jgi:hypothetical protein
MVPFHCQNVQCRRELARTDGQRLSFGVCVGGQWVELVSVRPSNKSDSVKLTCPCGRVRAWKRNRETLDSAERICYNASVPV